MAERRRLAALGGEPTLEDNPLDYFAHQRARRRIVNLRRELAEAGEVLEVAVDGKGVYGHDITMARLSTLIDPLGQSLRQTAMDMRAFYGDETVSGVNVSDLIEPVFAGTFESSFGIRVRRAPVDEQLLIGVEPLFDRTVERFVNVFKTARDTSDDRAVVESAWGLRTFALSGFKKLASAFVATGETARLRWQGEESIAVTTESADLVETALSTIRDYEEPRTIRGYITGADMNDEKFHIIDASGATARHYRGGVEPEIVPTLATVPLDSRVEAQLLVRVAESQLFATPRETYVLVGIRSLEE